MSETPRVRPASASEYRPVARNGKHALVHPSFETACAAALIEGAGCVPISGAGRGGLLRVDLDGVTALVRPYRRGGLLARLLPRRFLLDNRAKCEMEAHLHAAHHGVKVPALLGVMWEQHGPWFGGAIATVELDGMNLQDWLAQTGDGVRDVLRELGRTVRTMHDAGVWHADLQVRNVVVHGDLPWLIDFDQARVRADLGTWARAANLLRLERSFQKNELPAAFMKTIREGYGELPVPPPLRFLYEMKHLVSDMISGRWWRPGISVFEIADGVSLGPMRRALGPGGEELKRSTKWLTRRNGPWVVKRTAAGTIATALRNLVQRGDGAGSAWRAAQSLQSTGVGVPAPGAYVEWTRCGLLCGRALVMEYLDGWVDVEEFARRIVRGETPMVPGDFLDGLSNAVNRLNEHAYHADLSGKNIFTRSGVEFVFIDLDSVADRAANDEGGRLKNLIQLLDSFCDHWDDAILDPFIANMLAPNAVTVDWLCRVKDGQRARRERQGAIWKRQGVSRP